MKKRVFKFLIALIASAVTAGALVFCGFAVKVPKGVTVDGVPVGGKTREEAVKLIRANIEDELRLKKLEIYGAEKTYTFCFPEIGYRENARDLVKRAKKNKSYKTSVTYYLNGLEDIAAAICRNESVEKVEPSARFCAEGEPFVYDSGHDGKFIDGLRLAADIKQSLNNGFSSVNVVSRTVYRRINVSDLKRETRLLSSFVTYYDASNYDRAHNIALAAAAINGTVIDAGEEFSFNETVGVRSRERGYRSAKIIERGEFVEGVGGGVCQVSTTLFNAALLSGLEISEYHPHSLQVGYVPPSRDAMVSGSAFDLKFKNVSQKPVYIRAKTGSGYVKFNVYGLSDGGVYSFSSRVTGEVPADEEITEDAAKVREGKNGIISEGYLTVIKSGVKKTRLFRKDRYAPVKRVSLKEQPAQD